MDKVALDNCFSLNSSLFSVIRLRLLAESPFKTWRSTGVKGFNFNFF